MRERSWTREQWEAITLRGGNILVAAGAGAGKTAVLVERVIRHITDPAAPIDVDKLLVVTFTNAAAAEMRERIAAAISREIEANPGSLHLTNQSVLLNRASITTIHSLCLDILKKYFFRLELDPSFRVANDVEAALLQLEVLEAVLEEHYDGLPQDHPFFRLVDAYGGRGGDGRLQEVVLKLYQLARSNPWPLAWLDRMADNFLPPEGAGPDELPWGREILSAVDTGLQNIEGALENALALTARPGGPACYGASLEADLSLVRDLRLACARSWDSLHRALGEASFKRLKPCREEADPALRERVKSLRDEARRGVKELAGGIMAREPGELCLDIRKMAPLMRALMDLVAGFHQAYRRAKLDKTLVDFGDLEHYCLDILLDPSGEPGLPVPSAVAVELRERFQEVLVDEYQDINAVQETLLGLLARPVRAEGPPPNLFMVGDVKQSIYRFRLADPGLFLGKYMAYGGEGSRWGRSIDLVQNFRSRLNIIHAVNDVFSRIMTPGAGEMAYDKRAELVYGACYPRGVDDLTGDGDAVELYLLERNTGQTEGKDLLPGDARPGAGVLEPAGAGAATEDDGGENQADLHELDAARREARLVARRINRMLEQAGPDSFRVYDQTSGSTRPVTFRDIVVLMRSTRSAANIYLQEFRRMGIPAYADLGTGYFEAVEVETVLSLLKVIDNPCQDIPLAAVLRSALVGLGARELAGIRLRERKGEFYRAVVKATREDEGETAGKLKRFLSLLQSWRTMARRAPLAELVWDIYRRTGYYDYVGGLPGGLQRQANLRALHDRARQYEETTYRGLFRFLRFIHRLRDSGGDLGAARGLGENENVVRIMSIHRSKGLEFPVVFLSDLGRRFNFNDLQGDILVHRELGLGPVFTDTDTGVCYSTLPREAVKRRLFREMLAEEMRVLYVAMTRAREKLVLTGSVRGLPRAAAGWCEALGRDGRALSDAHLMAARTPLDWLGAALAGHVHGAPLRLLAGAGDAVSPAACPGNSRWSVRLGDSPGDCPGEEQDPGRRDIMEKIRRLEPLEVAGACKDAVARRLDWRYPQQHYVDRPGKISVTELKRRFDYAAGDTAGESGLHLYPPSLQARPGFLQESGALTGAELGSAVHLVMQHLELKGALDAAGIREQVAGMLAGELLTEEQAGALAVDKIAAFFDTALGRRMVSAAGVQREVPFTLALPAREVYPPADRQDSPEPVIVQGVIDCLLDEEDGMVLVDYKTDAVYAGRLWELTDRYRPQVELYVRAAETILKRRVKERYLYFFHSGDMVPL